MGNLLISQGLAEEISLLVHPVIVGGESYNMFSDLKRNVKMELIKCEVLEKEYIWLVYRIIN